MGTRSMDVDQRKEDPLQTVYDVGESKPLAVDPGISRWPL